MRGRLDDRLRCTRLLCRYRRVRQSLSCDGIKWQRSSLDGRPRLRRARGVFFRNRVMLVPGDSRPFRPRSRIIEGYFESYLASVFSFACKALPHVILTPSGNDDAFQVDPGFPYQICFLVVCEDGHFQLIVVRRIVNCKTKFLVPRHDWISLKTSILMHALMKLTTWAFGRLGYPLSFSWLPFQVELRNKGPACQWFSCWEGSLPCRPRPPGYQ